MAYRHNTNTHEYIPHRPPQSFVLPTSITKKMTEPDVVKNPKSIIIDDKRTSVISSEFGIASVEASEEHSVDEKKLLRKIDIVCFHLL